MEEKELLAGGYIRESCKLLNIDLIPYDIILLLAIWVVISDSFDINISDPDITIEEIKIEDTASIAQAARAKAVKGNRTAHTAFGASIITKGDKISWKFQVLSHAAFIIGIMNDNTLQKLQKEPDFKKIGDFTTQYGKGSGLWKGNLGGIGFYQGSVVKSPFRYGQLFTNKVRKNDKIIMTLDLTDEKDGKLSYSFETKATIEVPEGVSNVACGNVDINGHYRLAVSVWNGQSISIVLLS